MKCLKCGTENAQNSKYCIVCGNYMGEGNFTNTSFNLYVNQNVNQNFSQSDKLNYIKYIISVLFKPIGSFKDGEKRLDNVKNSLTLSAILVGLMVILGLIGIMYTAVVVRSYNFIDGGYTTTLVWENLKSLDYFNLIIKNFMFYAGFLLSLSGVYFISSLVFKKQITFTKLLAISATSIIPGIAFNVLVAPILSMIYAPLGIASIIVGSMYSFIIFIELINEYISFNTNEYRVYYHAINLSILGIAAYYVIVKTIEAALTSGVSDLISTFN